MTQDSTGRPEDDPTAKFEHGSAPNTDPGPYGPTAYGQQYQYPQPGYPPPGYPQPPSGAYGAYPGYPPPAQAEHATKFRR